MLKEERCVQSLNEQILKLQEENKRLTDELAKSKIENDNFAAFCIEFDHELNRQKFIKMRYERFFTNCKLPAIIVNDSGIIKDCNKEAFALLGGNINGQSIFNWFKNQPEHLLADQINLYFRTKQSFEFRTLLNSSNSGLKTVLITSVQIDGDDCMIGLTINDQINEILNDNSQTKWLNLLKYQNVIFKILNKVNSVDELQNTLFKQLCLLTKASRVWGVNSRDGILFYKHHHQPKRRLFQTQFDSEQFILDVKEQGIINGTFQLNRPNVYLLFNDEFKLENQLILAVRSSSLHFYFIGLDYYENIPDVDTQLLNSIYFILHSMIERFESMELLAESESRYRAFTEKLDDVILIRDGNGKYTYASPSVNRFGLFSEAILGRSAKDFVHQDDLFLIKKAETEVLYKQGGSVKICGLRVLIKNIQYYCDAVFTNMLYMKSIQGIVINVHDVTEKVYYENQLAESEKKYRALFENANDGICLLEDLKLTFFNNRLKEQLRIPADKLLGLSPIDVSPEYQSDGIRSDEKMFKLFKQLNRNESATFDWIVQRYDQTLFEANISLSKLHLNNKVLVIAILHDISNIKEAQRIIQESQKQMHTIFEAMNDGVYVCDDQFNISFMNKAIRDQIGADITNKKCYHLMYGFDTPCNWCKVRTMKPDKNYSVEVTNPKNKRVFNITKTFLPSEGKMNILHITRDITEQKTALQLIIESEKKFRNIFNNSNDPIIITDLKGNYLEVNEVLEQQTGKSKYELLKNGNNVFNLKDIKSTIDSYYKEVIESGKAITEFLYCADQNQELYIELSGRKIRFQGSDAIIHLLRDVSERREVSRQLLQTKINTEENERSRFARDLHDGIGPYLSATKFFLKSISRSDNLDEREGLVNKAVDSIDEVIAGIKEISNNISPHLLSNFGIDAALRSFVKKLNNKSTQIIIESNIQNYRFHEHLEMSIFRVFIELINNTFKYANAQHIRIRLELTDISLYISYSHNGLGFDMKKMMNEQRGSGLNNVIARIQSLNGQYQFETSKESNFKFSALFNNIKSTRNE